MMDLSLGKAEKEYYVVNVKLSESGDTFTVYYADGHTVEHPFTVHNFNVFIYRMKMQYLNNREKFETTMDFMKKMTIVREVKTLLLSYAGLVLTTGANMPDYLKIIFILLLIGHNAAIGLKRVADYIICNRSLDYLKTTGEFVKLMEDFKITVKEPHNGEAEDWYLINIGDVKPDSNYFIMRFISYTLTPEVKEREGKRISAIFKDEYEKRLVKKAEENK